jgi:hypothetical protein
LCSQKVDAIAVDEVDPVPDCEITCHIDDAAFVIPANFHGPGGAQQTMKMPSATAERHSGRSLGGLFVPNGEPESTIEEFLDPGFRRADGVDILC